MPIAPHADTILQQSWRRRIRWGSSLALAAAFTLPAAPAAALSALTALGILLVGLPHGALDLALVAEKRLGRPHHALFSYVGLVALSIVVFRIAPSLCLALFLGASAWHFGSADGWRLEVSSPIWALSRGALVVGGLVLADPETVQLVLADLQVDLSLPEPLTARRALAVLAAVHLGITLAVRARHGALIELVLLVAAIFTLRPTAFFALYFLLWHSSPHLGRVLHHLHGRVPRPLLWTAGIGWTAASVAIGGLAWWLIADGVAHPTSPLIILSIAVTLPHLLVVQWGLDDVPAPAAA